MTPEKLLRSALLTLSLPLAACAAPPSPPDGDDAPTGTAASSLANDGAGGGSRWCSDGFCTCTGDADCNDMFSSGACADGDRTAICQINDADVPRCRCTAARTSGGVRVVRGGVLAGALDGARDVLAR